MDSSQSEGCVLRQGTLPSRWKGNGLVVGWLIVWVSVDGWGIL